MALKKKPVTGMKDVLPAEMELRDYVLNIIKDTYRGYGFSSIETPCVEHIENLTSKQGGDIDILGDGTNLAEIETILAITRRLPESVLTTALPYASMTAQS